MMTALLLERPAQHAVESAEDRRRAALELIGKLETWLPAEEARLVGAGSENGRSRALEAHWQAMLHLYERLCMAAACGS